MDGHPDLIHDLLTVSESVWPTLLHGCRREPHLVDGCTSALKLSGECVIKRHLFH